MTASVSAVTWPSPPGPRPTTVTAGLMSRAESDDGAGRAIPAPETRVDRDVGAGEETLEENRTGRDATLVLQPTEEVVQLRRGLLERVDDQHDETVAGAHRSDRVT